MAGGDGSVTEEAPIGYYRFHFWQTEDKPRGRTHHFPKVNNPLEHENWIGSTEETGPICISLMRHERGGIDNRTFYRLLIRTIFVLPSKSYCLIPFLLIGNPISGHL